MNRKKLDYMAKGLSVEDEKELYDLIDIGGHGDFNKDICGILENPKKKDIVALSMIPSGMLGQSYVDKFVASYELKFKAINLFCTQRKMFPIFNQPDNIKASVNLRKDILLPRPEEELNVYFGTESFAKYVPPIYEKVELLPENKIEDAGPHERKPEVETVPPQPGS